MKKEKLTREKQMAAISETWGNEEISRLKQLIEKLLEEDDFEHSEPVAKQLTAICPEDPEAWFLQGCNDIGSGELNKAKQSFYRSLELGGKKVPIFTNLSSVYMQQGNFVEAILSCRRALKRAPREPMLHHRLAELHDLMGNTAEAIKILEALLKTIPKKSKEEYDTRLKLGHLFQKINDYGHALIHFEEAFQINSSDAAVLTNIGHCFSRLGEFGGALEAFRAAAVLRPDVHNLYNLGDAYLALGNSEDAVIPLLKAVRQNPDHSLAHYDLSLAFFRLKKYREGAAAAQDALKIDPEMRTQQMNLGIGATTNLGLCLWHLGKHEEALECLKRNEKMFSSTYFNLGLILFKMKRFEEALKYFLKATEIKPDDAEYLNLLGQTYDQLGEPKKAEKFLKQAIKTDQNYGLGYYDLGVILAKDKERQREAARCFNQAIELEPDMEWAYYSLACLYNLAGKKLKALEYLKLSLEKGLRNRAHIDADHDLDSLREEPRFKKLMNEYFGGKMGGEKKRKSRRGK